MRVLLYVFVLLPGLAIADCDVFDFECERRERDAYWAESRREMQMQDIQDQLREQNRIQQEIAREISEYNFQQQQREWDIQAERRRREHDNFWRNHPHTPKAY